MFTKRIFSIALLMATATMLTTSISQAGGSKILNQTGCGCCCPVCDHVCKLDVEETEKERTCFEVESKVICIPRVVFPWQKAKKKQCASCRSCDGRGCTKCVHNGARLRRICVAKPKTYTCPACKYTWTAEKKGCGNGCCGGPACDGGCICDSTGADIPAHVSVPNAAPLPPQTEWESKATAIQDHQPNDYELTPTTPVAVDSVPVEPVPAK